MGLQIEIAQSARDEQELRAWLAEHVGRSGDATVMELPLKVNARDARRYAAGELRPAGLGKGPDADEQLLFYADGADALIATLSPVVGAVGVFQFTGRLGLSVEWKRTRRSDGRHFAGRFYWSPGDGHPLEVRTRKLFEAIRRYVKKTAARLSSGPVPIHVGPDLARQIASGEAALVYPSGKPIPLREP